jgi:hypothetical protein
MPQSKPPATPRSAARSSAKSAPTKPNWVGDIHAHPSVDVTLTAAVIAVTNDEPVIAVLAPTMGRFPPDPLTRAAGLGSHLDALPSDRFDPKSHVSLDDALRTCIQRSTALEVGYLEQLYTFTDRCYSDDDDQHGPEIAIGYLALAHTKPTGESAGKGLVWQSCYHYFPWEDWRHGKPAILREAIEPQLMKWAEAAPPDDPRADSLRICFGIGGNGWDEERVLERYELLMKAGLLQEARDASVQSKSDHEHIIRLGTPLAHEQRRILAAALGRLRAKIKYRPVVFELMPPDFTLFELQRTVEAILGPHLHKQNFRRLVENMGLVEPTGDVKTHTGGRPAKLFRFRRDVLLERPAPGVRVRVGRN